MTDFFNFFGDLAETLWSILQNFFNGLVSLSNFSVAAIDLVGAVTQYLPGILAYGVIIGGSFGLIKFVLGR